MLIEYSPTLYFLYVIRPCKTSTDSKRHATKIKTDIVHLSAITRPIDGLLIDDKATVLPTTSDNVVSYTLSNRIYIDNR